MIKYLEKLIHLKDSYNKPSQAIIESLSFVSKELEQIESMKRTEGWQILNKKIREELHSRILNLVKDDLQIQTLLSLLNVADTKTAIERLEKEIEDIIPQ